jgi:hypothetical protein
MICLARGTPPTFYYLTLGRYPPSTDFYLKMSEYRININTFTFARSLMVIPVPVDEEDMDLVSHTVPMGGRKAFLCHTGGEIMVHYKPQKKQVNDIPDLATLEWDDGDVDSTFDDRIATPAST